MRRSIDPAPRIHPMACTCRRCAPQTGTRTQIILCLIALIALAGTTILITLFV
jgi:hypothetical protein